MGGDREIMERKCRNTAEGKIKTQKGVSAEVEKQCCQQREIMALQLQDKRVQKENAAEVEKVCQQHYIQGVESEDTMSIIRFCSSGWGNATVMVLQQYVSGIGLCG